VSGSILDGFFIAISRAPQSGEESLLSSLLDATALSLSWPELLNEEHRQLLDTVLSKHAMIY